MQIDSNGKYINVIHKVGNLMNLIVSYEEVQAHPGGENPLSNLLILTILWVKIHR